MTTSLYAAKCWELEITIHDNSWSRFHSAAKEAVLQAQQNYNCNTHTHTHTHTNTHTHPHTHHSIPFKGFPLHHLLNSRPLLPFSPFFPPLLPLSLFFCVAIQ